MYSIRSFQRVLTGALLIGLGCAAFFIFTFKVGQIPPQVRFFDIWIPFVVVVFMLILIRALKPGQPFHFWEGLISGNLMCWLGGFISGLLIWQYSLLDPVPFQNFLASSIRYLEETEKTAPDNLKMKNLPQVVAEIRETRPSFLVWDEVKKKVIYSFLVVPLVSMIFRRK